MQALFKEHDGVGYLTQGEWERLQWVLNDVAEFTTWLDTAGYIRSADEDVRVQSSRGGHVNLPPTWLASDAIQRMVLEINPYSLEYCANHSQLSGVLKALIYEVEQAKKRWPLKDRPHRVSYMRCQVCQQETLRYLPPRFAGDDIIVKCTSRDCGAVLDERMYGLAVAVIEQEQRA